MRVKVFVTPKAGILDPQGKAVEQSLKSLGFKQVGGVKIGKYIVLDVEASSADEARASARMMCEQLLANPLIEDFTFEVDAGSGPGAGASDALPEPPKRRFRFNKE